MKLVENPRPDINSILLDLLNSRQSSISEANDNGNIANISRFIPETIITLYKSKEQETLLKKQLENVQKFILDERIQSKVAQDFDKGNYRVFDPSNGDNGCESRSSLLEIMQKQSTTKYAALKPEEKLFLTLCHVLRFYQLDQRDIFGILVYEKMNAANIGYDGIDGKAKLKLSNSNKMPQTVLFSYTACELMGQAMSAISVEFIRKVDEIVNAGQLTEALKPYQRELKNKKLLPQQLRVFPSFTTMLNYIKAIKVPLLYRVTRMETILSSGTLAFKCQGAALIVKLPKDNVLRLAADEEIAKLQDQPVGVFEMYSVSTQKTKQSNIETLKPLSQAETFDEYLKNLKLMDLENLIFTESQEVDNKHANKDYKCTSGLGGYYASSSLMNSNLYERNMEGSILTPCHFYISTYNMEKASIAKIPLDKIVGRLVEPDQYVER